jgi:hypothetical protein
MAIQDDIKNLDESIAKLEEASIKLEANFNDIAQNLASIARGSIDFGSTIKTAAKDSNDLAKSTSKLRGITKEDLKDKKIANNYAKAASELARNKRKTEQTISFLEKARLTATEEERKNIDLALEDLYASVDAASELEGEYKNIVTAAESLNNATGFLDSIESALKTIPGLGPLIAKPFKEASQAMRDVALEGGSFFDMAVAGADKLSDSFGPTYFLGSLFAANQESTNLAKTLGISAEQGRELRTEFTAYALSVDKAYISTQALGEAEMALAEATGVTAGYTLEQLENTVELTKLMGLTNEEASRALKFGILNNKSQKQVTTEILDQVVALEQTTGISLDGKKIAAEVLGINGQLAANYGYNNELLAKAVIQVKQFGLNLEQAASIANNLLDFEQSIGNEIEAELLTGRSLNLEQARYLSLTGDVAGAAAEVAKQVGSSAEFSKMNRIQQEALAAAVGLEVDQLANSLMEREALSALGVENIAQLEKEGRLQELLTQENGEQLYNQYMQQSAAEKFQGAVIKIQEAIGSILEVLSPIIDKFAQLSESTGGIYAVLGLITTLSLAKTLAGLAAMALQLGFISAESLTTNAALTFGLGTIAVGAAVFAGLAMMNKAKKQATTVNDAISPSGYGDRILSTPKGSISLNNNDTLVAGTNLGGGNSGQSDKMIGLLEQIANKQTNINMDGYKVGTALALV